MSRTIFRLFGVLLLAVAALTVRTDATNNGDLNWYFSGAGNPHGGTAFVPTPAEGIPEPAMLLVFGLGLAVAAWRVRRAGA